MRRDPNLGSYGDERDDPPDPLPPVLFGDLYDVLRRLVGMWQKVREDDRLPDCLNDVDAWDEAADLVRRLDSIPDIFDDLES